MADAKQQFLLKAKKSLDDFKNTISAMVVGEVEKLDSMKEEPTPEMLDGIVKDHKQKIKQFEMEVRRIVEQAVSIGLSPRDPETKEIKNIIREIEKMLTNPISYAHNKKINDRKEEVRALEPTENLGSVDIGKVMTKEEIEERMFDLHVEQENAISSSEKDEIQKQLDHLLNLYKNSSARNRFKK